MRWRAGDTPCAIRVLDLGWTLWASGSRWAEHLQLLLASPRPRSALALLMTDSRAPAAR
jgi:hypothetical protein